EAEVARVEVDRRIDVVDHIADVDQVLVHVQLASSMSFSRKGMRAASSAAVRSKASESPPRGGAALLQWSGARWPGTSGQTSRTRSHSVTTASNRRRANSLRCLERRPARSMP